MKHAITGISLLLLCSFNANSQWNTSGNDINNTNSGNVGIGTSSPGAKLDVTGGSAAGNIGIRIVQPYNSTPNALKIESGQNGDYAILIKPGNTGNPYTPLIGFQETYTNLVSRIGNEYGGELFLEGGNNFIRFGSPYSGVTNVRIRSYVYSTGAAPDNYTMLIRVPDAPGVGLRIKGYTSATGNLTEWTDASNNALSVVSAGGNLGLGVSNPQAKLDVAGNSNFTQKSVFNQRTSIWGTNTSQLTIGFDNDATSDRGVINYSGIAHGYNGNGAFINAVFKAPNQIFGSAAPNVGIINFEVESPYVYDLGSFTGAGAALRYKLIQDNSIGIVYGTYMNITRTAITSGYHTYGHFSRVRNFNGDAFGFYADVSNYTGGTGPNYAFYAAAGKSYFANEVAIGTSTPVYPEGYKLSVGGNIIAEKVRVKLQSTGWPDYVFNDKYPLPSLKETEQFIKQNNHLPGVPSAAQIEKEGLDLGDGQAVLLKKIEELTLHLIELDKKIEKLQAENEALKKKK